MNAAVLRSSALTCGLIIALVSAASVAAAGETARITFVGPDGTCPSRTAVIDALRAIIQDIAVARVDEPDSLRVELLEEDRGYRVRAGGAQRDFASDDCLERARKTAVYLALILRPPLIDLPTPVAASLPPVRPRTRLHADLDVGGLVVGAAERSDGTPVGGGALVRLFVGTSHVGGVVSATGLSPVTLALPDTRVRLTRAPFGVGLRGRHALRHLELSLDVELVLGLLVTSGLDTGIGTRTSRLEVGIALTPRVEYPLGHRLGLFVSVPVEIVPRPYELAVPGTGAVGSTPRAWVGGTLGLVVRIL